MAQLRQEVAYIASHFHWPYDAIMNMEHRERVEWVQEINRLLGKNQKRFE